jgi:hypothetical protein
VFRGSQDADGNYGASHGRNENQQGKKGVYHQQKVSHYRPASPSGVAGCATCSARLFGAHVMKAGFVAIYFEFMFSL